MRYQGGKSRIAGQIAAKIRELHPTATEIWEPFCGGGAVTLALAKAGFHVHATDNHPDLILMYQALARCETEPFRDVTEEEFKALKYAPPSARRGFVRFGGSFGGDFNAGYGRNHYGNGNPQRQYVWQDSQRSIAKLSRYLAQISWNLCDYRDVSDDALVYADKPYEGVYAYQGRMFDHDAFWSWVRHRSGATFVSELQGPDDIEVIWHKQHKSQNASNSPTTRGTAKIIEREERLYWHQGSDAVAGSSPPT